MRVLVIEDERRLSAALCTGLEAEGFVVDAAHTGPDGLWMAGEHRYDAIVLDILLPGLNGYRVCTSLRKQGNWTPILMLTAKDGEYDEVEALEAGADDYVTKPFSYLILVARLRTLIRRGAPARPVRLNVGDLELDPATRSCARAGTEIPLTAKEYTVLELLARRQGQVVSKQELLADGWDFAFIGDANVVEVHISALRKKIDVPFERRSIRTVRGKGYQLSPDRKGAL